MRPNELIFFDEKEKNIPQQTTYHILKLEEESPWQFVDIFPNVWVDTFLENFSSSSKGDQNRVLLQFDLFTWIQLANCHFRWEELSERVSQKLFLSS